MARTKKKVKYNEGDWFAVPLTNGHFGVGLIARVDRKMHEIIGYFFGDVYADIPVLRKHLTYSPGDAVLIQWVVDRGIVEGLWPIILTGQGINKQKWIVPVFGQPDYGRPPMGYWIRYDNENPSSVQPIERRYVLWNEVCHLPSNGLAGHIALERKLSHLLLEGPIPPWNFPSSGG